MSDLLIREFTSSDGIAFRSLNIEWLNTYFEVEPYDEQVLSYPEKEIIAPGGYIFMADFNQQTIGTYAFIFRAPGVYEFSKMAITPPHRGKGFGNIMMQAAIDFARKNNWEKIILYSSRKLENSIHLYRKYRFVEVPLEENAFYARGDIKMELNLVAGNS